MFTHHRGKFHSLPTALLLALPVLAVGWLAFLAAITAYASHLVLDNVIRG
jgi:membrane-bound metal-dependent hydrolase YbcI (DUF457 family)